MILQKEEELTIPSSLFCDRSLSPLETVSEYLKEVKSYNFHEAGVLLHRDERTIWTCYHRAKNKRIYSFHKSPHPHSLNIPVSIFHNRTFSSLEVVVVYLKDKQGLSFREISILLNRDERTVWTCYHRSQKKMQKKTNEERK